MKVTVDNSSGFCFGVQFAIDLAEEELRDAGKLYSLGDIVHNGVEVKRLSDMGLHAISLDDLSQLKDTKVLIRAHGEPPSTYKLAMANNIELIDASCPVVLKLQRRIKDFYDKNYQIVIYGKTDHAEIIGLNGQCNGEAIITKYPDAHDVLEKLNTTKKAVLFSQTTQDTKGFYQLADTLKSHFAAKGRVANFDEAATQENAENTSEFLSKDTICRQVSNRDEKLKKFSKQNDVIVFVSGKKSSNGKVLFECCKEINPRSYFVEDELELLPEWFDGVQSVGICGATSTPMWLMEKVADYIRKTYHAENVTA
jgi:4-hydroxy-3-methylbut-2-enyl diphosphate reductase